MTQQEKNKQTVTRFNKEYIEGGNSIVFDETISPRFINHTAPQGVHKGPEGVRYFFENFLKPAFHELKVVIHDSLLKEIRLQPVNHLSLFITGNLWEYLQPESLL